jgi:hypothetical protein
VGEYNEGGLAFDSDGNLWAITDRSLVGSGSSSQILRIDENTGAATVVSSTINEIGFESLAITAPTDCVADGSAIADEPAKIPTLSQSGRLLTILILLFAGMIVLRRRVS